MKVWRKVAPLWRDKAKASSSPLVILSPFITGALCRSLVRGKTNAKVYTRFDVALFASGGSSLDELEKLLRKGHQLFQIDDLHAKVVMDDTFVTIGSQNLTKRGRLINKELTAAFDDSALCDLVRECVTPWLEEAKPITTDMIALMRSNVGRAAALHRAFRVACEKGEETFQTRAAALRRDQAPNLDEGNTEPADVHAERIRQLQVIRERIGARMIPLTRSQPTLACRVVKPRIETHSPYLSALGGSFTKWLIGDKPLELDQGKRYLCVLETGDIGWVRIASGRITKISRGFTTDEGLLSIDRSLSLELSGEIKDLRKLPPGANLACFVWRGETKICTIPVSFSLTDCNVLDPLGQNSRQLRLSSGHKSTGEIVDWLLKNKPRTRALILKEILGPFKFRQRLLGENADSFFGEPRSYCFASIAKIKDSPILLVRFPYRHKRKRRRYTPASIET